MLVLEHVSLGGKASDINLLSGQLLLSQQVILNDISAKFMNQGQGSRFPLLLATPKCLLNRITIFQIIFSLFLLSFYSSISHIICSVDIIRRATQRSPLSSYIHFSICVFSVLMKNVKNFLFICLVITQIDFEHLYYRKALCQAWAFVSEQSRKTNQ